MSDDKVTIDPEFRSPRPGGEGNDGGGAGPIVWVAAVMGALLFGWLLWSSSLPTEPTGPVAPTLTMAPDDREPPTQRAVPLERVVPGFTDALTALTWDDRRVEVLRWAPSQAVPETIASPARGGRNRGVDASGRWYSEIRGDLELVVRSTDPDRKEPGRGPVFDETSVVRVWSSVWHDTRPGRLALLTCPRTSTAGPGALDAYAMVDGVLEPLARQRVGNPCAHPGVWLAGWGDWGTLLETRDELGTVVQMLIDPVGTEIARGRIDPGGAWFIAGASDGTTIWTQDPLGPTASSFVLSADGRRRSPVPGLAEDEWLDAARWSPDGSLIALSPFHLADDDPVIRIVESETGVVITEIPEPGWRVSAMVWSADGRFLVYERWPNVVANWAGVPHDVEVVFHDTVTDAKVALPLLRYAAAIRSAYPRAGP